MIKAVETTKAIKIKVIRSKMIIAKKNSDKVTRKKIKFCHKKMNMRMKKTYHKILTNKKSTMSNHLTLLLLIEKFLCTMRI